MVAQKIGSCTPHRHVERASVSCGPHGLHEDAQVAGGLECKMSLDSQPAYPYRPDACHDAQGGPSPPVLARESTGYRVILVGGALEALILLDGPEVRRRSFRWVVAHSMIARMPLGLDILWNMRTR